MQEHIKNMFKKYHKLSFYDIKNPKFKIVEVKQKNFANLETIQRLAKNPEFIVNNYILKRILEVE